MTSNSDNAEATVDEILMKLKFAGIPIDHLPPSLRKKIEEAKVALFALLEAEAIPISHTEDAVPVSKIKELFNVPPH